VSLPLHRRIRDDIERAMIAGELPPGARLPIEQELAERYGCSRMTVSKALSALVDDGMIERRKKAGSFVRAARLTSMAVEIPDLVALVRERGQRYGFRLENRRMCQAAVHGDDFESTRQLLEIEGIHLANDVPFAAEWRLVNPALAGALATLDLSETAPGSWLLANVPWSRAENAILAENASAAIAKRLVVAPGSACLVLDRQTWRGSIMVTKTRQHFRSDAFQLVARLERSKALLNAAA
jgi:GntR family transcriptional regulator, histidine utilization repressor